MTTDSHLPASRFTRRRAIQSTTTGAVLAAMPLLTGDGRSALAQDATPVGEAAHGAVTDERVSTALVQLPSIVEDIQDRSGVPGIAVGVVYADEVRFLKGYGVREAGVDGDVDTDTVFQLASVSKALASTVVASVVGAGTVTWDTNVVDIDPSFALNDPWVTAHVTLADLFSHRSGLPDHGGDAIEDLGGTREEVLHALRFLAHGGEFRASYAYTNFGVTAAAVAAARAAGAEWEDLVVDTLYAPAGMTRTTSRNEEFMAMDNRAAGHSRQGGEWIHAFDRQPDAQSPAGGVSSSVADLGKWLRLQLNDGQLDGEQLVAPGALGETHAPHSVSNPAKDPSTRISGFYALGWDLNFDAYGNVMPSHSGGFIQGAATTVYMLPAFGLGIVVLTNGSPVGAAESIAVSFLDICRTGAITRDWLEAYMPLLEELDAPLYGASVLEPPSTVQPASGPETYTGTFANEFYGELEVLQDGEQLAMLLGPRRQQFPLTHYSRDVFTYEPVGENATGASAVTFTISATGQASRVVIENLDLYGAGTFVRSLAAE